MTKFTVLVLLGYIVLCDSATTTTDISNTNIKLKDPYKSTSSSKSTSAKYDDGITTQSYMPVSKDNSKRSRSTTTTTTTSIQNQITQKDRHESNLNILSDPYKSKSVFRTEPSNTTELDEEIITREYRTSFPKVRSSTTPSSATAILSHAPIYHRILDPYKYVFVGASQDTSVTIGPISNIITLAPVIKCTDLESYVPELSTSLFIINLSVKKSNENSCVPVFLNLTCSGGDHTKFLSVPIETITIDITDPNNKFFPGIRYNCTAFTVLKNNETTMPSTPKIVPVEDFNITVQTERNIVSWNAPFQDREVSYIVNFTWNHANYVMNPKCPKPKIPYYPEQKETNFVFAEGVAGNTYTVEVSTEFWNFSTEGYKTFDIPSAAPEKVEDISLTFYSETNKIVFKLQWEKLCKPNGELSSYEVQIKNKTNDVVYEQKAPAPTEEYSYSLELDNISLNSEYTAEIVAIGTNNLNGTMASFPFSTKEGTPTAPADIQVTEVESTKFKISWGASTIVDKEIGVISGYNISISPVGPIFPYIPDSNCSFIMDKRNFTTSFMHFTYNDALPYYTYHVSVWAVTTLNKEGERTGIQVQTNSSSPSAPLNLNLTEVGNDELKGYLNWSYPCFVNGNATGFRIYVSEAYTEDMNFTQLIINISTELEYTLNLKYSHFYIIKLAMIVEDDIEGEAATLNYTTQIGFPGVPKHLNVFNIENTSFYINWSQPLEKRGPILSYEVNITSGLPLYDTKGCEIQEDAKNFTVDSTGSTEYTFHHDNALPFNNYIVKIAARTTRGYGEFASSNLSTRAGVPDNIQIANYTINNVPSEIYYATMVFYFYPLCYLYGPNSTVFIGYHGVRENFEDHKGIVENWDDFEVASFILRPEYQYTCSITTSNGDSQNTSTFSFDSPAGVPIKPDKTKFQVQNTGGNNGKVVLRKEYFNNINGDIRYIALILTEDDNISQSIVEWNPSNNWPDADHGIQLTPSWWYPFNESDEVAFSIGTGNDCNDSQGCNEPLKPGTLYYLTIRVFTNSFFRNTDPITFQTDPLSHVAVIVGIVTGIIALALMLLIVFLIWKRGLYGKLTQLLHIRTSFSKPLPTSTTAFTTKKFIQFFRMAQNKPEILKEQFISLAEKSKEIQSQKTTFFAALSENRRKNRYANISPYDETRVKLLIDEDDEIGSDYINASYVKGYTGGIEYIATQGPLPTTYRDFWKMVIQENVTIIVMVSNFVENNKIKCHKYFPKNHENLTISDDMEIRCSTELHFGTYIVRNLQVRKDTQQVPVTHFQFLEWPDFKVPNGTDHMLQFIYQLRQRVRLEEGLIVVHCSAGVGRTGTLIAADTLLQNTNAGRNIDVYNTVLELRKQRVMMVQTEEQYIYLHRLVLDHIERPPTPENIDSDPVYENMDMLNSPSYSSSKKVEEESQF